MKILLVCLGNICRSPTAEAVLRHKAAARGQELVVDSAGTIAAHAGEAPDRRSIAAGEARGYDFTGIYSRKVRADDFINFDLILAADNQNVRDLKAIAPQQYQNKIRLLLSYAALDTDEIPDPYYGGTGGFNHVIDLIERASDALLEELS
ncbi:low molecular weight protein-tyrosine-phosphatase [Motilimonas eburnea]|uniref:low molecular weight protein-tyrosine-phosphatase n=1 Tax=Motilimonas eburnea TaxID=1737488 RepID=UPI001E538BF9|nr:low molecular weight protein-tyrosine-phosphatase [Motilimonas eburnea]MCE2570318.1 low molecular weight phosphotyrosine protein phosphatase [Motilimonas eburnea]